MPQRFLLMQDLGGGLFWIYIIVQPAPDDDIPVRGVIMYAPT